MKITIIIYACIQYQVVNIYKFLVQKTKVSFVCKLFHVNSIFHNYLIYFMELTTAGFMISYQIISM